MKHRSDDTLEDALDTSLERDDRPPMVRHRSVDLISAVQKRVGANFDLSRASLKTKSTAAANSTTTSYGPPTVMNISGPVRRPDYRPKTYTVMIQLDSMSSAGQSYTATHSDGSTTRPTMTLHEADSEGTCSPISPDEQRSVILFNRQVLKSYIFYHIIPYFLN